MNAEKRRPGRPSNNESKRTEILEKAASCFNLYGYNKTTLDEIGDALGFNKAALYYYFKNKEELFKHVMKHELERLWEKLNYETNQVEGFEKKLIQYFSTRTDGWINIVKINGLSKDNLINLNTSFSEAIMSFRASEISFLESIMRKEKTNFRSDQINDFLNLLLDTQASITMSAILLDNIDKDPEKLKEVSSKKTLVLKHFVNSFLTGYFPGLYHDSK